MDEILSSKTATNDFISLFLGKRIGFGSARSVYEHRFDKTLVIKVETACKSFQNVEEWEVWEIAQNDKKLKNWFAPCVAISDCGAILLQKKTVPAYRKDYPKEIPKCFGDLKYDNFGMLDGRFVCNDYGTFIISNGIRQGFKKAIWWGEESS